MNKQSPRRGFTQGNKNAVNKNSHSRRTLSGIFNACRCKTEGKTLSNGYVEDPRQNSSGMTPNFITASGFTAHAVIPQACNAGYSGRVGFTLIELLVVVLIIGILAAVALPQYNKAVKKAQGTEVLNAIDALTKAANAYYLEYGTFEGANAETFSVQMPDLKHFVYKKGTEDGTHAFQVGSIIGKDYFGINFYNEQDGVNITLGINIRDGFYRVRCDSGPICGQYFNCNWRNRNAYPGDTYQYCFLR